MTDVYLCRHGRTPLNAAGALRGRLDPDLDEVGLLQAQALATRLAGVRPVRVVSSPLRRAVQTAEPLAATIGVPVEVDPRLIDRSYGSFDGTPEGPLIDHYGSLDSVPGVESASAVAKRAVAAVSDWAWASDPGPVALVSHDAVIRLLLATLVPYGAIDRLGTGDSVLLRQGEGNRWLLVGCPETPPRT